MYGGCWLINHSVCTTVYWLQAMVYYQPTSIQACCIWSFTLQLNNSLSSQVTSVDLDYLLAGIVSFEIAYDIWVAEQHKKDNELKEMLQSQASELELRMLVDSGLNHYYELFQMKVNAARADVFYLMHGLWRTPIERFFQWLGGPRPSELLYVSV